MLFLLLHVCFEHLLSETFQVGILNADSPLLQSAHLCERDGHEGRRT